MLILQKFLFHKLKKMCCKTTLIVFILEKLDNKTILAERTSEDTSKSDKQLEASNEDGADTCNDTVQNSNHRSFPLAHRNLSRKNCLLTQNISEICHTSSELKANDSLDKIVHDYEKRNSITDAENCKERKPNTGNLCNNNSELASDVKHKSVREALKNNDPVLNHSGIANISLNSSSDNDKDSNKDPDSNLPTDKSRSLSEDSSSASTSVHCTDETDNAKGLLNLLDNNNKDSLENAVDKNESFVSSESICKMSTSQDAGCSSSSRYSDTASTSKPFKLPILEKIPKTVHPPEVEENAVALLEPSYARQDQLEEVRCLDLEPRSSNSSEESNSDIESQHASTSHSDMKKVSKFRTFYIPMKRNNFFLRHLTN